MALGSFAPEEEDFKPEINTTPLVDVMLVLLIVFMVTLPAMAEQAPVDLPQAAAAPLETVPHIELAIDAEGGLRWNGEPLAAAAAAERMSHAAQQVPRPELRLQADRRVAYEHVARALAAAQVRGLDRVAFVTTPERP